MLVRKKHTGKKHLHPAKHLQHIRKYRKFGGQMASDFDASTLLGGQPVTTIDSTDSGSAPYPVITPDLSSMVSAGLQQDPINTALNNLNVAQAAQLSGAQNVSNDLLSNIIAGVQSAVKKTPITKATQTKINAPMQKAKSSIMIYIVIAVVVFIGILFIVKRKK